MYCSSSVRSRQLCDVANTRVQSTAVLLVRQERRRWATARAPRTQPPAIQPELSTQQQQQRRRRWERRRRRRRRPGIGRPYSGTRRYCPGRGARMSMRLLRCRVVATAEESALGVHLFGSEDGSKAVVDSVQPGSAAHRAGLRVHDQVVSIGGYELGLGRGAEDLSSILVAIEPQLLQRLPVDWVVRRVKANRETSSRSSMSQGVPSPPSIGSATTDDGSHVDVENNQVPTNLSVELAWHKQTAAAAKDELARSVMENAKQLRAIQQRQNQANVRLLAVVTIVRWWRSYCNRRTALRTSKALLGVACRVGFSVHALDMSLVHQNLDATVRAAQAAGPRSAREDQGFGNAYTSAGIYLGTRICETSRRVISVGKRTHGFADWQ